MKKIISFFLIFCSVMYSAKAQNELIADNSDLHESTTVGSNSNQVYFRFISMDQSNYINQIEASEAGSHFLGETLAKKQYLLKKRYTYKESIAPGSSATKLIYRKPDIYFSVRKIEKYLKTELKKEKITSEVAAEKLNKVLDVALNVLEEDTEKLERRILSVNGNPSDLLKIFVFEVELQN